MRRNRSWKTWLRTSVAVVPVAALVASLLPAALAAPSTGTWESLTGPAVSRQEASYVNLNGKLHLLGWAKAHHVYNPANDSWSNKAGLPLKLDHVQAVALGGKIYMVGGLTSWPDGDVDTVYIYNPNTDSWSEGATMPTDRGRGAGATVVRNGKIYYAGGLHDSVAVPWFDVYDPATDSWSSLPDMPRAREHFHGAVVNNKLWATGGRQGAINSTVAQTDAFNFSSGEWETGFAPIPTQRGGFAVGVSGDELIVFGGEGGGIHPEVEAYDTGDDDWRDLTDMATPRHGIQAAECGGAFYIATGATAQGGGSASTIHDVFRLSAGTGCGSASTSTSTTPPPVCTGADDATLDEDGDGYTNADEIDNGTDPCSAASKPSDNDGDGVSDLNDNDDDDDGKPDNKDPFAIDADNGSSTSVPVSMSFDDPAGGLAGTGFTGLMTNGSANYRAQYNPSKLDLDHGAGMLTVERVHAGDAFKARNSQRFGLQFGVMPSNNKFTVSALIDDPFGGMSPKKGQSMGVFIGNGTQAKYVKLVLQGNVGGRVNLLKELKNTVRMAVNKRLPMPGPDSVELFITIDPAVGTLKASFVATTGGVAGPRTKMSKPVPIPAPWYDGSKALAVGIISTSRGPGAPFPATWDAIEVQAGNG